MSTGAAAATHLDAQTSAATLRWAGSRVRVAPLTLPSPEHELTDPMRGAGAVPIPGSHPGFPPAHPHSYVPTPDGGHGRSATAVNGYGGYYSHGVQTPGWDVMTPGGTRRSRLSGFWSGTADVEDQAYVYYGGNDMLPTIDGSPATPAIERDASRSVPVPDATVSAPGSVPLSHAADGEGVSTLPLPIPRRPPPATAPVRSGEAAPGEDGDYFGVVAVTGRRRGRSSLRTPPRTREGSVSALHSSDEPSLPASAEQSPKDSDKPPPFSAGPTTPDSNPKRPALDRATSGPPAATSSSTIIQANGEDPAPEIPPEPADVSENIQLLDHLHSDPPNAFSSNSSLTKDTGYTKAPDGTRPVLPHASTLNHPSTYSVANGIYTDDPYPDGAYVSTVSAYSVPAPAPRRALARQMSAPLPRSAAAVLGTLAPATPRALSSDPGRDAREGGADSGKAPDKQKAPADGSSKEDARAVREERAFAAREFLAPPYPPDELGRRRALYK
jgi:hypothetical protein